MSKKKSKLEFHKQPLPNLEDPEQLLKKIKQKPTPTGFGYTGPEWEPRMALTGTADENWFQNQFPRLPDDFDPAFFNGASPGLIAPHYFSGGEQVEVVHASELGNLKFTLPTEFPETIVMMKDGTRLKLEMNLDTVIVNTDENKVNLIWRTHMNAYQKMQQIHWTKAQLKMGDNP